MAKEHEYYTVEPSIKKMCKLFKKLKHNTYAFSNKFNRNFSAFYL